MVKFNIIIPTIANENRPNSLQKAIQSILNQTYDNYSIIVVHDGPNNNKELIKQDFLHINGSHVYEKFLVDNVCAGGARNAAIDFIINNKTDEYEYTMFLDDDDILYDKDVLYFLDKFIRRNNYPEIIRGGYLKRFVESGVEKSRLLPESENVIENAILSKVVSASCKAVRNDKLVKFPERVKHQDVVHHIAQLDNCTDYKLYHGAIFIYNIYDRPDKDKHSPESQKAKNIVPTLLYDLAKRCRYEASSIACKEWARKITRLYS